MFDIAYIKKHRVVAREACSDEFVEITRRVGGLRLHNGPVASFCNTSSLAGTSCLNSPRVGTRSSMPAIAGPSSGVRQSQSVHSSTMYLEQDEQQQQQPPTQTRARPLYDGQYYIIVVGRSPGVYRNE